MAITKRSAATWAMTDGSTNITGTMPTAVVGDIVFMRFFAGTAGVTPAISLTPGPTGVTRIDHVEAADGNYSDYIWWKQVVSTDIGASVKVSHTNASGGLKRTLDIIVLSGCTVGHDNYLAESTAGTAHTAPTVLTANATASILTMVADRGTNATTSWSLPSGMGNALTNYGANTGGASISTVMGLNANVGAGSGHGGYVVTGTLSTIDASMATVALEPTAIPLSVAVSTDQTVAPGASVSVTAAGAGGGGSYTYAWTQAAGGPTLTGASSATVSFTAPASGAVVLTCTVSDGTSTATATSTTTVQTGLAFVEGFNSGTAGEAITTSNSAFSAVAGTITRSSTWAITGMSAKFDTTTTNAAAYGNAQHTTSATIFYRVYYYFTGRGASATNIGLARNGSTGVAQLRVDSTGVLGMRNGTTGTPVSTSYAIGTGNTAVRLEWSLNTNTATQTLRVFAGANLQSATPTETISMPFTGAAPTLCEFGVVSNPVASYVMYADDIAVSTSAWVGPSVTSTLAVDAGSPVTVAAKGAVTLTATPTGGTSPYTYSWTETVGTPVAFTQTGAAASFTAPATGETETWQVTATDNTGLQATDTVQVTVAANQDWFASNGVFVPLTISQAGASTWL